MKPKEYKVETIDDLLDLVNDHSINTLPIDIANWLFSYNTYINAIRKEMPEVKDKKNTEILKGGFTWIDDGKSDLLGVELSNSDTGEVRHIKFK